MILSLCLAPRTADCMYAGPPCYAADIVHVEPDNPVLPPFSVFQVLDSPCVWFPGQVKRIERAEVPPISPEFGQALVDHGWWRLGTEIRRRACPDCTACHELRVDAQAFRASRAQVRAWKRAQAHLVASWEQPGKTEERWALIQRHAKVRFDEQAGSLELRAIHGYGDSVHGVLELRTTAGSLVALAVVEILTTGLLARIAAWDETAAAFSPGVVLIMHEIAEVRRLGLRWLYLGPVVEGHSGMGYKRSFRPNETLAASGAPVPMRDNVLHIGPGQPCTATPIDETHLAGGTMPTDTLFHDLVVGAHQRLRTSLGSMTFFLNANSTVTEANLPHALGAELACRQAAPSSPYAGWTSIVEVPTKLGTRGDRRIDMLIVAPDRIYVIEFKVFWTNNMGGQPDGRALELRQQLDDCMSSDLCGLAPRISDLAKKQIWIVGIADAWGDQKDLQILSQQATLWRGCAVGPTVVPGDETSQRWDLHIDGKDKSYPYAWVYGAWKLGR